MTAPSPHQAADERAARIKRIAERAATDKIQQQVAAVPPLTDRQARHVCRLLGIRGR